ncbi:ATP phosphoribosyltransferase regulatory subunit HisZ (HisZ) (PDB:3OD1) (PUBMED:9767141) [Commensalibacter papalotli (ex Botero et al. 2024)]|uniref:ATP phosphoribosyltransferase regulatory subunit n=2 Tax=Commensalibacter papalotli (ex Botero et al. 2024) TaxID=2972766 RepID=A0ABN8W4U9_9PROT|nr:ATP phosphoribosyltransferase regulatory subunit [Commensalibacter papalotli (ex Botero et al. 2024)]CAI3934077.1 ATP phosphoribosyltransferase regulatory subunit HisZ (HisZ) (PDB:3OD1) (PUBMED:9767141) [Commensalibacter papalotli (ex Botero et al. 2024)]CAI3950140.1 ATP phosphoribosyltransferase regulatory subunit HisZ (HisZ) (PDB:3OD1) (PUBMED:9767141) [Commensalibacter papalotli (ex Botero et al. 2024)]
MIEDLEMSNALLPIGFCDLLPSDAEAEASLVQWIMSAFNDYGYERVSPPLLEFEQSLLANAGSGIAEQTFRVMDPETHYMMGLRPDITPQIARIAATRLINSPRPLRLSYAGPCILVSGAKHSAARQILQAGIELIGVDSPQADAEIITIIAAALAMEDVLPSISIDLMMPQLANTIIQTESFDEQQTKILMRALDRKDVAAVQKYGGALSGILTTMLQAAGPADRAINMLKGLDLPQEAQQIFDRLLTVVEAVQAHNPDLQLTIDPVEFRGWNYHTGLCFSVYINGVSGEVGRGGRYLSDNGEPACGLTLRPDLLLPLINFDEHIRERVFVPFGHTIQELTSLRQDGYILIMGLTADEDAQAEACRLNCNYILQGKELQAVAE